MTINKAIITLAEYEGWVKENTGWFNIDKYNKKEGVYWIGDTPPQYTEAEPLLRVWRKLNGGDKIRWQTLEDILYLIAENNYPEACIQLAEIIKQLKEKV